MSKAIAMKAGSTVFLVEVDELAPMPPASTGARSNGDFEEVVATGGGTPNFNRIRDMIVESCRSLHEVISQIPTPEKISMEFGVKAAGEAGVPMLTKASGEANIKVTVEWKRSAA